MRSVRASLVVVAFHRPERLASLLQTVADPAVEVVVVNVEGDPRISACVVGTREVVTAGNVGYAAAVNLGAVAASNDVVVFSNDDVELCAADVLALASTVAGGAADIAVPLIVDHDGRPEYTIAALPTPWALLKEWALLPDRPVRLIARGTGVQKWRLPGEPEAIEAAAAVVVAVRRELLLAVPLPEDYFLYWEEMEWFWRVRERGKTAQCCPEVVVFHAGGRADLRGDKARLMARNAVRCVRRTQGRGRAICAWLVVILWNGRLVILAAGRALLLWNKENRLILHVRLAGLAAALASWREAA